MVMINAYKFLCLLLNSKLNSADIAYIEGLKQNKTKH
jgi:hypothetical protein